MPPGQVRMPSHRSAGRVEAETWLFLFFLTMIFSALSIAGFAIGVVLQRAAGIKARWIALVAFVWLAAYVAWRHGDLRVMAETHFFIYGKMIPAFMRESLRSGRPFEVLGLGMWWQAFTGLAWLGIPLGLLGSCGARMSRRTMAPEWHPKALAERERVHATAIARAQILAADPPDGLHHGMVGVVLGGDMPATKVKTARMSKPVPWLQLPPATLDLPRAFIGLPGFGKTHTFERLAFLYARMGRKVIFVDGKGTDPGLAERIVAAYIAGSGNPYPRVGLYPDVPMSIWRGTPRQVIQKVMAVWEFAIQHQFFEAVAEGGLSLAIDIPGQPPIRSSEDLVDRLDMKKLERLHAGTTAGRRAVEDMKAIRGEFGFNGFAVRARSLLRSIGTTLDGDWAFEDVEVAVITVPSAEKRKDASAIMRVILEDFLQYATLRKPRDEETVLIFDEFSALEGGRRTAVDAVERLRSTHTAVMLGAQSIDGLGDPLEARRLLSACSGGVFLFATPNPEEVIKMAGSIKVPSVTHNLDAWGMTDRGMVRPDSKFKVDPDSVRSYEPGECSFILGGRATHLYVATTRTHPAEFDSARAIMAEAERVHAQREAARRAATEQDQPQEGNHRDRSNVKPLRPGGIASQECP